MSTGEASPSVGRYPCCRCHNGARGLVFRRGSLVRHSREIPRSVFQDGAAWGAVARVAFRLHPGHPEALVQVLSGTVLGSSGEACRRKSADIVESRCFAFILIAKQLPRIFLP